MKWNPLHKKVASATLLITDIYESSQGSIKFPGEERHDQLNFMQ